MSEENPGSVLIESNANADAMICNRDRNDATTVKSWLLGLITPKYVEYVECPPALPRPGRVFRRRRRLTATVFFGAGAATPDQQTTCHAW